ncbi:MAG TPA: alpha/beta fold hydrolase [Gracilimonas sp.]|uniref:YheT family hydrolase n=1 Tax=Gracilimonas sp. TaxID=1974203 RepID=UPI002D9FAD6D|nr:alpha/beta fold hydrolase [Gracilimonas sp.]
MKTLSHSNIQLEPFEPVWWAWNTHVHTVVASQLTRAEKPDHQRLEVPTPDDDFLEVDVSLVNSDKPIVALFHGLEGSTDRHYIANLMGLLKEKGFSSAALNFRGCGSKMNLRPRFYHSGETQDYRTFLGWLKRTYPEKQIFAVGYSLGANALVKYLGEEKDQSLVQRAVAVSPPYDLKEGSIRLQHGFNRIYEIRFLKTLVEKLELKRQTFSDMPEFHGNTIYEFDDQVTAKLHNFEGADDYYHQCSSKHFYGDVKTDLLVIHSKEDTLCPIEFAPSDMMNQNPCIQTCFTDEGGHVGFLSSDPGWLYRVILKWLRA